MKKIEELSLQTMTIADEIVRKDRLSYEDGLLYQKQINGSVGVKKYVSEHKNELDTKKLIASLYDDICFWICGIKSHNMDYKLLFKAIVRTFLSKFTKDEMIEMLNEL